MKALRGVQYAAASITIITGVLQLLLSSTLRTLEKGDPTLEIFFIGIGVLQLFWAVGIIRKWGSQFYSLVNGITIALIFLWVLLRLPKPIIGGLPLPIDSLSVAIEVLQIIFFALCTIILAAREEHKLSTTQSTTIPPLKTNIMNNIPITSKFTYMASRRIILGIGAAVLIIGLAGVTYSMSEVLKVYEVKKTSTPPYTSEPPVQTPAAVYVEVSFIIILIAGLFIASYGATLGAQSPRPEIGR